MEEAGKGFWCNNVFIRGGPDLVHIFKKAKQGRVYRMVRENRGQDATDWDLFSKVLEQLGLK